MDTHRIRGFHTQSETVQAGTPDSRKIEVKAAVKSKSDWPDADTLATSDTAAAKQVAQWKDDGNTLETIAIEIYKPLRMDRASKAIAAQHAARLLETTVITEGHLPTYLVEALAHLHSEARR